MYCVRCRTGVTNGQPKLLLSLIPDYPLINFMLTTAIYILVTFSTHLLPNSSLPLKTLLVSTPPICLLSFLSMVVLYLKQVSHRFFELINRLKSVFVPHKDNTRLLHMAVAGASICVALYIIALIVIYLPRFMVSLLPLLSSISHCFIKYFTVNVQHHADFYQMVLHTCL